MSAIPPHPLLKPHLDPLAGLIDPSDVTQPEEVERRVQELLNEWQKFYFSGVAFSSPRRGQADRTVTFEEMEILWDHATPKKPGLHPILHTVLMDRRDGDPVKVSGRWQVNGVWQWNTFIRANPQLPASPSAPDPAVDSARATAFRQVRRAGDQYVSLLRGPHAQELVLKGIGRMRVLNGPRPVPAAAWIMRQIVYSAQITYFIEDNEP